MLRRKRNIPLRRLPSRHSSGAPANKLKIPSIVYWASKEPTRAESPEEREVRDEISNQRYEAQSKRYLDELRRSAMIEIR